MAAAFSLLLSGCSKEDSYQESTAHTVSKAFTLQVNASAYSSAGTRASDTGITTTFASEDKLGIIVTHKDGSVEHFVYTYDGSSWTSSTPFYYNYQDSYAAYYPYKEDLNGKTLSEVKSAFTPPTDQSDYATGYAASDLMTCKNAILDKTDWKLQITLTHAFSMLRFPADIPVKSRCEDGNTYQYSLPATDIVFHIGDTPYKPWMGNDGYARLIVGNNSNSDISVKSSYTLQGKQTETSGMVTSFASGQYYTLIPQVQDLGDYKFSDVRVGDFYCKNSDGNGFVIPHEASLPDELKNNCIGIVFHTGKHNNDMSNYSNPLTTNGPCIPKDENGAPQVHGYAVALADATDNGYCKWGVYGTSLGNYPTDESGNPINNYGGDTDWSGYHYTQNMKTAAEKDGGSLTSNTEAGYPAAYYALNYETTVPAPANSSGWFLPAISQMWQVYQIRNSFSNIGGSNLQSDWYWSSSEFYYRPGDFGLYVDVDNGYVRYDNKSNRLSYVRPVLAF